MKPPKSLGARRALVCGLFLLGASHSARAQPPDQIVPLATWKLPRAPQSTIDPAAAVALPAQFSAPQFFDAIARATNARIVAPIPDNKQLEQLRQLMGGRTFTLKEIFAFYEQLLGYRFSTSRFDGNLIQVRLPDETIYPTLPLKARSEPFLRLIAALSRPQIDQMYLRGHLVVQDLTPAQIPLYIEARRANPSVGFGSTEAQSLTDEQILAQPLSFHFAFQATVSLPDNEQVWPMGIFDYGTGLIWNVNESADTKALAIAAREKDATPMNQTLTVGISSESAHETTLDFPQTRDTTLGAIFDDVEQKLDQKVAFEPNLNPRRWRAQPVVITAGRYRADELMDAVAASAGLDNRFRNDVPTLQLRAPQQPISQLPPLVEQAQQQLRRLPLEKAGLPFFPLRFERKAARFSELFGSEQFYLQARLLNEATAGTDKIDLSESRVRFENNLYFIASRDRSVTTYLQLD